MLLALVVDDSAPDRAFMEHLCANALVGWQIEVVATFDEAEAALRTGMHSVAFIDYHLDSNHKARELFDAVQPLTSVVIVSGADVEFVRNELRGVKLRSRDRVHVHPKPIDEKTIREIVKGAMALGRSPTQALEERLAGFEGAMMTGFHDTADDIAINRKAIARNLATIVDHDLRLAAHASESAASKAARAADTLLQVVSKYRALLVILALLVTVFFLAAAFLPDEAFLAVRGCTS